MVRTARIPRRSAGGGLGQIQTMRMEKDENAAGDSRAHRRTRRGRPEARDWTVKTSQVLRRFFIPGFVVSILAWIRFRCLISPRSEVELTRHLRIGKNTQVGSFTKIKASDGPLDIGAHGHIGPGCFITSGPAGVRIGDFCMISAGTSIVGNNYRYDHLEIPISQQGSTSSGIEIGWNVWIGTGCTVLDGASIGSSAIITPNSVVSSRIPENAIAQGNPARVIFTRR